MFTSTKIDVKNDSNTTRWNFESNRSFFFQPKLTINQPNDIYEQEADAMADKVMRMTIPEKSNTFFNSSVNTIQRQCTMCDEEKKILHRKENSGSDSTNAPPIVHNVLNSSNGKSLDIGTRSFFEPRFSYDFSNVRVHTGSVAAKSADIINALAYTSGNNIVFNENQYSPETDSGKKLLAHELTHVVQEKKSLNNKCVRKLGTNLRYKFKNQGILNQVYRKVNPDKVTCSKYPKSYPIFKTIGTTDPVAQIQSVESEAIKILNNTITELTNLRNGIISGDDPKKVINDCLAQGLKYRLLIDPYDKDKWINKGPYTVERLINIYSNLKKVFEGGNLHYVCLEKSDKDHCDPGTWAYTYPGEYRIYLCLPFWRSKSLPDKALTFIHELTHVYYSTEDWGFKGIGAAHCLEQFLADREGVKVPKDFSKACSDDKVTSCSH